MCVCVCVCSSVVVGGVFLLSSPDKDVCGLFFFGFLLLLLLFFVVFVVVVLGGYWREGGVAFCGVFILFFYSKHNRYSFCISI